MEQLKACGMRVDALYWMGARVQMHPASDAWMQGDRFGTVVGIGRAREYVTRDSGERHMQRPLKVKLDVSGRVVRAHPDTVIVVG